MPKFFLSLAHCRLHLAKNLSNLLNILNALFGILLSGWRFFLLSRASIFVPACLKST